MDAAGRDLALRFLLHQDVEFWGHGVGAPCGRSHPMPMTWSPASPCEEGVQAAARADGQKQPEPTGDEFDPSLRQEFLARRSAACHRSGNGPTG
ncbi:hypothetical protein [Streptomyces sp. 2R]|uniref:hypothetical protein n=1 Tax=Streptomyces sp. 2R TaxID=1883452 RepID=UPI00117BFD30|nr:hypothetical protein [Streptomyces sp. 2R]